MYLNYLGYCESKGIVKRILMLDRALSGMNDKQARAQLKLVRQAEKLYLKAAENSGNAAIKKMILSQRRELEEKIKTDIAFDKKMLYNSTESSQENIKSGDNITNVTNEKHQSDLLRRDVDDLGGRPAEISSQSGRAVSAGNSGGLYRGTSKIGILSYDTEGRVIPNEIIKKIKKNAIKDEKGRPIVVYHATAKTFEAFAIGDIGFHFGNKDQANSRARAKQINNANYIRAYLNIEKPLIIEKDYMNWHANAVALNLWNDGIFSESEKDSIISLWKQGKEYDSPAAVKVREILIKKGYDGIAYKNEYEGEGYSFIAFDNGQIVRYSEESTLFAENEQKEALTGTNEENVQVSGEKSVQMDLTESKGSKITAEMSDSDRAEILKDRVITAPVYEGQADALIAENESKLESKKTEFAREAILEIAHKLDIIGKQINFQDIEVQIQISKSNLKESVVKNATPKQIAKLLPILSKTAGNSVVIERHNNRYYHDTDTIYFDNLLGAYVDNEDLVPVRFGLKHSRNDVTTLYVVVDQNKIALENLGETKKDRGPQDASPDLTESNNLHRSVSYSIAQIIPFVNSKDLLRYIPDDFLNDDQIEAKKKAVAETEKYTDEKNDKKYSAYVEKGLDTAAKQMLSAKAKSEGYGIDRETNRVYKAFDDNIKTLDITYDDEGNLIPITKRYDSSKKDIRFNLKERDPKGDFFAEDNDAGPAYKVSGGKVQKIIADNTRMKVYSRAESEAIINQIVSEQLSFGELYGVLAGKSKREVIDILWEGLNSADVGQQGKVALDVAEYIIKNIHPKILKSVRIIISLIFYFILKKA